MSSKDGVIEDELAKVIESHCSRLPVGQIKVQGCVLPSVFKQYHQDIKDFKVRPDDVWILSYPKCGTTWTQEMVWLLLNNCDFDTAKSIKLPDRSPFLEFVGIGGPKECNTIESANQMKSPRLIKCHLPVQLLPLEIWSVKPKMIYVYRDPRDVAISYFHHMQLWYNFTGSMELLMDAFIKQLLPYDPFWEHVICFWALRDKPNFCFNTFEEMKADLGAVIDKTSKFLGINVTEDNRTNLLEHLSFNSMQKNDSVNYSSDKERGCKYTDKQFIRQGQAGAWKSKLTKHQIEKFDRLARIHLNNVDFPFYKPDLS